ncbi:DUF3994 domain-containing protein [Bacillus cereus group sp. BfR-BA-01310]|uniref:DUF3994 domain-containing protein n=1 Tax=Bacillus cereus group sp. BfR-BA-01310 TaxID=2920287 RepID=UPI001F55C03B|nr:hypothetical protein [Bacillus cereus group sp. BfR-BA-01310]
MKSKRLITLALPIMLLGGCATDKAETKAKDKVEEKAVTKEKIALDKYPDHMYKLKSDLEFELQNFRDISAKTKDKSNDIKELNKELYAKEIEIQGIIEKFHKIEPPKEFEKEHKTILKGVDYYSESFTLLVKSAKSNSITKETTQKSKDLVLKGNELILEGYTPLADAVVKAGAKKLEEQEKTQKPAEFPKDAKEFVGEWGQYSGSEFTKSLDFKEDGTYIAYDDVKKLPYETTHMSGKWTYKADTKQISLTVDEMVKDGNKLDASKMKGTTIDYTVEIFYNGYLNMVDSNGIRVDAQKRK